MSEAKPQDTSILNLYQKLARITGEVGAIKKGGTNREQHYQFIEYAAVAGELRSLFAKYNVVVVPYMARSGKQSRQQFKTSKGSIGTTALIDFTFVVINADKPDEKFSVTWTGEATDYGDKATNKAATSALKYYLMRQFNISEQGDDPDADSPKVTSQPVEHAQEPAQPELATKLQKGQITAWLRSRGVNDNEIVDRLRDDFNVQGELTRDEANRVLTEIKKIKEAEAAGNDDGVVAV